VVNDAKGTEMKKNPAIALAAVVGLGLAACAPGSPTPEQRHEMGCAAGTVSGAVVGGLLGSLVGGGTGQIIATGAGASIGAMAGQRLTCG
jgi:outer membrane lipoprotein SlyB